MFEEARKEAFREGAEAARSGAPGSPYALGTYAANAWREGYLVELRLAATEADFMRKHPPCS